MNSRAVIWIYDLRLGDVTALLVHPVWGWCALHLCVIDRLDGTDVYFVERCDEVDSLGFGHAFCKCAGYGGNVSHYGLLSFLLLRRTS